MRRKSQVAEEVISGRARGDLKTRSHSSSSQGESSELKRTVAKRTIFTPQQLYYLEERFVENQFPDADQRERIASHLNLTSQHIQNKRAKARRKLKKLEIEKSKVHVPKPPSFWPQHLPFDSNFTETLQSPIVTNSEMASHTSSSSTKTSQTNHKPHTSTVQTTSDTFSMPTILCNSSSNSHNFSFIDSGSLIGANPHKDYLLDASFSHNTLCSNGSKPSFNPPHGYNEVREISLANQALNSSCPTALPRESPPFQQSSNSIHYHMNTPTSRYNGMNANSASLLLLANCATLATSTNNDGIQRSSPTGVPKVSSVTDMLCNPNSCYRGHQYCDQYNQPATTEFYPFNRLAPMTQLSSVTEMERQELHFPAENIQAPMFSEEGFPLQAIFSNREPEWHIPNSVT